MRYLPAGLFCLLALSAAALAAEPQSILRRDGGTGIASLDPARLQAPNDSHAVQDLFEGLVVMDRDGRIVPGAAASWTVSADATVYTFTLRAGLRWSNGDPLTAEDFVYSFRRGVDPRTASPGAFLYFPITFAPSIANGSETVIGKLGVTALGPQILEIRLRAPTPYFLGLLCHPQFLPVRRAAIEIHGAAAFTRPADIVSNGAYEVAAWAPRAPLMLTRNPYYHDAAHVHVAEIVYQPVADRDDAVKRYRAGDLDIAGALSADQIDTVRQALGAEYHVWPLLGTAYYGFNLTRPPFMNAPGLRQALALVIDRRAITDRIVKTGAQPAFALVPPDMPGYAPPSLAWRDWPMARRLAEAQKLYRAAGYGPEHPLVTQILYDESTGIAGQVARAVAAQWHQALGVETALVAEDAGTYLALRRQQQLTEVFDGDRVADDADPSSFLDMLRSTSESDDFGYRNSAYDALTREASLTPQAAWRLHILEQAEGLMLGEMPLIPLYHDAAAYLVKPYVRGFHPNIFGYAYAKDIVLGGY